jgi:hypothetical protein
VTYISQPCPRCSDSYGVKIIDILDNVFTKRNIQYQLVTDCDNMGVEKTCVCLLKHTLDQANSGVYVVVARDIIDPKTLNDCLFTTKKYHDNPILVLTIGYNLESNFFNLPKNISFIPIGAYVEQSVEYPLLKPQREKNPNMERFWISLSHGAHMHRILSACYLLGQNLGLDLGLGPANGLLRISPHPISKLNSWTEYCTVPHNLTQVQQDILQTGFLRLQNGQNGGQPCVDPYAPYANVTYCDNVSNFDFGLRPLYYNSLIEIVNETVFFNRVIAISEKTLNSIYGYNLPIILAAPGTIEHLRQFGFDMFDDVIDHSYDAIINPLERICSAIDSNSKLLSDKSYAWQMWEKCLSRLDANHTWAQNSIYQTWLDNFKSELIVYADGLNF